METTTALPIFAATFVILAVVGAKRRRRLRWLGARTSPTGDSKPVAPEVLKESLRALAPPEAAYQVFEENGRFTITWQLHGIPWATLLFRRKLRETQALDVRLEADGRARVSAREGSIEWETAAATWMPRAKVTWRPARDVGTIPSHDPEFVAPAPTAESPRDFASLVAAVRPMIVNSGWSFEPVIDSEP